jgi:hypothetical protein
MSFPKELRQRERQAAACVSPSAQPRIYDPPSSSDPPVPFGRALCRIGYPHVNRLGWMQRLDSVGCRMTSEAVSVIRDWLCTQKQPPHLHVLVTPRQLKIESMAELGRIREVAHECGYEPCAEAIAIALISFWTTHPVGQVTNVLSVPIGAVPSEGAVDSRRLFYIETRHGVRWLGVRSARPTERLSPDSRLVMRVGRVVT